MARELGDIVYEGVTLSAPDTDDTTSIGDAAALAAGDLEPGDANSGHEFGGVVAKHRDDGDETTLAGPGCVVIATVDSGLTAGTDVDLVDTSVTGAPAAGTFVASAGGRGHLLSDEGGSYKGSSLGTGEAAVLIH